MDQQTNEQPVREKSDPRKNLRSPLIALRVRMDDGQKSFFGYTKNISRSGIFIGTVNPREPGSQFRVEIPLPAPLNRTVECTCEVVWKRHFTKGAPYEPGMGLRFTDLPEEIAIAIATWIDSQEG